MALKKEANTNNGLILLYKYGINYILWLKLPIYTPRGHMTIQLEFTMKYFFDPSCTKGCSLPLPFLKKSLRLAIL